MVRLSDAQRRLNAVREQAPDRREVACPVCRREIFLDVLVGVVISGEEKHPTFGTYPGFYGLVRRATPTEDSRSSEPRPWLDTTITCRRGHRLQVPLGPVLERLIERAPDAEPIYLRVAPEPDPIKFRF